MKVVSPGEKIDVEKFESPPSSQIFISIWRMPCAKVCFSLIVFSLLTHNWLTGDFFWQDHLKAKTQDGAIQSPAGNITNHPEPIQK